MHQMHSRKDKKVELMAAKKISNNGTRFVRFHIYMFIIMCQQIFITIFGYKINQNYDHIILIIGQYKNNNSNNSVYRIRPVYKKSIKMINVIMHIICV